MKTNPQVELVLYWFKRHAVPMVILLLTGGAVGFGFFWQSGQKARLKAAHEKLESSKAKLNPSITIKYKPDQANLDRAKRGQQEVDTFVEKAKAVMAFEAKPRRDADFMEQMRQTLRSLNELAVTNNVRLPNTLAKGIQTDITYQFSFTRLQTNLFQGPRLPDDQCDAIAPVLHDVSNLSGLLLTNGIVSLEKIQRIPIGAVPMETNSVALKDADEFLADLAGYQTDQADVAPYRVTFRCYPSVLNKVVMAVAQFSPRDNGVYVTRSVTIAPTTGSAKAGGGGGFPGGGGGGGFPGGGGGGGFPGGGGGFPGGGGGGFPGGGGGGGFPGAGGGGGFPGAGGGGVQVVQPGKLSPGEIQVLVDSGFASHQAQTMLKEELLEVVLHIDVIRQKPAAAALPAGRGGAPKF